MTMRAFCRQVLGVLLVCAVSISHAATVFVDGTKVWVNEIFVASLPSASAAKNFGRAIEPLPNGSSATSVSKKRSARVVARGKTLLTISKALASNYGTSPGGLANDWAGRLNRALNQPALRLDKANVQLGGTGSAEVVLVGHAARKAKIEVADEQVVSVGRTTGKLQLKAKGYGQTTVVISGGGQVQSLLVKVSPPAASFPQSVSVQVTGNPATAETIAGSVQSAIFTQLKTRPQSNVQVIASEVGSLWPDRSAMVPVRVRVTAPDCLPSEGLVNVSVANRAYARTDEQELWYCNDPENVKAPGLLFTAQLGPEKPARLLYHHYNASPGGLFIEISAINDGDKPAQVVLIPGDSKPDKNPVLAGADAGEKFLRNWLRGSGEIVTIRSRSTIPITLRRIAPKETMSGLCYLRLLKDGPSEVSVVAQAKAPFGLDQRWTLAMQSPAPWRFIGAQKITGLTPRVDTFSNHIYPDPFKDQEVNYVIGGRHPFIRIGEKAIPRFDRRGELSGNFGVVYTIKAVVENPYESSVDMEMIFEASAGYSGALFVVNGELKRTPLIQAKAEIPFARVRFEPGAVKAFTILTIPLSGSSYPATITMRPVEGSLKAPVDRR